jgi:hypothetical protein
MPMRNRIWTIRANHKVPLFVQSSLLSTAPQGKNIGTPTNVNPVIAIGDHMVNPPFSSLFAAFEI